MSRQYTIPENRSPSHQASSFSEKVVQIDRVTRTVKGGHRMRFRALVVIGDKKGRVGYGIGKAGDVAGSIAKATENAKKNLKQILIVNDTIPRAINYHSKSSHIILKPAPLGSSVIAGGSVRAVVEAAGIKNILAKIIGSDNKANNVRAVIEALAVISRDPDGNLKEKK